MLKCRCFLVMSNPIKFIIAVFEVVVSALNSAIVRENGS